MEADEFSSTSKNFRRTRHRKQSVDKKYECSICGDEAASYNFGAVCCESCKAFFRRNLTASRNFSCGNGGKCVINKQTRKFCSACRMQKCSEVGMSSDPLTVAYISEVSSGLCERRKLKRRKHSCSSPMKSDTSNGTPGGFGGGSSSEDVRHKFGKSVCNPSTSSGGERQPRNGGISNSVKLALAKRTQAAIASDSSVFKQECPASTIASRPSETINIDSQDCLTSVATCQKFAEVMSSPFSVTEMGPVLDNMRPDDPVALARFPEAALRKYVSALKNVPEFRDGLTQEERFLILKTSLIRQQGIVVAYFGDPYECCFTGMISTGATFCHMIDYTAEQFDKAGINSRVVLNTMMALYRLIREFPFVKNADWTIVAAYLCIIKFFSPYNFDPNVVSSTHAQTLMSVGEAERLRFIQLLPKITAYHIKYRAMFKSYIQSLIDSRAGLAPSHYVEATTDGMCENLLCETRKTCNVVATFFKQLLESFRMLEQQSDSLVPLMTELLM